MREIALALVSIFSIIAVVFIALYAAKEKRRTPWLFFSLLMLSVGTVSGFAFYMIMFAGYTLNDRVVPVDFFVIPLILWMTSMVSLSRANHDAKMDIQYERSKALDSIAKAYLRSRSLKDAAKTFLNNMTKLVHADGAVIILVDETQSKFDVITNVGEKSPALIKYIGGLSKSFEKMVTLWDLYKGKPEGYQSAHVESKSAIAENGFSFSLGVPIHAEGRLLAMIIFYSRREMKLNDEDKGFLDLAAFEIGLWMSQAKSLDSAMRLSKTQKGLLEISLLMQENLDADKISHSIIDKLTQLIPCRDAMVYLYNDKRKVMWAADAIGKDAEAVLTEGEFPLSDAGLAGVILEEGRAQIINDTLKDGRGKQIQGTVVETTAMLALPLISKKKILGIIELHRDRPSIFTQDELEIGTLYAQQVSAALDNAHMLDMMEREKDRSKLYLDLLSHDIANLNTPLYSYYDMLMRISCPPEAKEVIEKAHTQVEAMNDLVSRVRKLSKGDLEDMEEIRTVMINEVLDEALKSLKRAFPSKDIEINFELGEMSVPVRAGEMLDEIILNILHNGVKFSKEKKVRLDITMENMEIKKKWYCAIRIADYGRGIPDDQKPLVFEGRKASAASFARGFGIGLNMCKRLVEKYGGSIWVEDRVRGDYTKGACFVVTLPTMPPKQK